MEEVTEATVDLDAYFSRTGYLGGRKPTPETLKTNIARHTEAIPFGIDEAERRVWFLFETGRHGESSGRS